ncbi:MAG TPA: glycerol-3-phosphate dehydrogenase/oxidase [Actinomycetota bacterium]|jgi:glycerol-3-phosphate dehydrogenase
MRTLGTRAHALERLAQTAPADPLDLLVVGGGITGAGIALDASSRGLRTGLVERFDFASGTSSKSSKLVHGGLRYLEQREFGLVREASTERDLLRRLAPHLVEPIPFVLPVADRWRRAKFGVGLWAYNALATFKNLHIHRHVDAETTERLVPSLPRGKVKGGYLFYDCKTDDVRLVMEVLVQAHAYGAVVLNYAAVHDIEPAGAAGICNVLVEDAATAQTFEVRARRVVAAAGVWGDRVEGLARNESSPRLRPSKGVHVLFDRASLSMTDAAVFIPDAERRRMLFVIPWLDAVLVGTTDTAYEGSLDHPRVEEEDRAYCVNAVNRAFGTLLTERDIVGAYAGLRPLIAGKGGPTADLSRKHAVYDIAPGVIGITGGKLTTFRRMAGDAVDRLASDLGAHGKSRTRWIRLGSSDVGALRAAVDRRARRLAMGEGPASNLVRCYGERALAVLDVAEETGLLGSLVEGRDPLAAEAVYCARAEMARNLNDVLVRRTRLALTDAAGGLGPGSEAASIMGAELGWDGAEQARQVYAHRAAVEEERAAPVPTDTSPAAAGAVREGIG